MSKPWLQSYDSGVPENPSFEEICLPELLERTATACPGRMALTFEGYRITYRTLKDMIDRMATCLAEFGIRKGDAVAIVLPNTVHCVVSYYAIQKIGAIAVMNNPMYSDPELAHQLNNASARLLITIDLLGNRMIDLRSRTKIRQIIVASLGDYLPFPKNLLFPLVARKKGMYAQVKSAPDVFYWKDCLRKYPPRPPRVSLAFDDPAIYQYTGGTTGITKGVILTHANLSRQVQQVQPWFPFLKRGENKVTLGALPIFHVFGMTWMNFCVHMGWGLILIPKPQPQPLLNAIRKYRPQWAGFVPTMCIGILAHPDLRKTDLTCLEGCFSGAAPLPVDVIHEFEKASGAIIVEGYGMTETSPITHVNPFFGVRKPGSIGLPLPATEARIVDLQTGERDMPIGMPGELIVRGPQVTNGYLNNPEETDNLLRNGWCYTGDIATMDEQGYFYLVDRKKDLIITGGFNVYPREIDEVFYSHPKVREACTIGIPDAKRGENVKVFVVLKDGQTATSAELLTFCQSPVGDLQMAHRDRVLLRAPQVGDRKDPQTGSARCRNCSTMPSGFLSERPTSLSD